MRGESYTAYFIRAIRFLSMGGRVNKFYISVSSNIEFCYVMIISIIFLQTLHLSSSTDVYILSPLYFLT